MAAPSPEPFRLHVPDAVLDDLRARLERTRWPDEIPGSDWRYGTNLDYVRRLVEHWRTASTGARRRPSSTRSTSSARRSAASTSTSSTSRASGPIRLPLLLSHGWPGSVWEFHELIPRLTDPARFGGDPADAFTVVAPSLPGYALLLPARASRASTSAEMARPVRRADDRRARLRALRRAGRRLGRLRRRAASAAGHPEKLVRHPPEPAAGPARPPVPDRALRRGAHVPGGARALAAEETGYHAIQGTKPQTLAYALTDSPAGLAALDRREVPDLERPSRRLRGAGSTEDSLLTNIMLYWVTGAINSSFWPYYAIRHEPVAAARTRRSRCRPAYAAFPRETRHPPRRFAERVLQHPPLDRAAARRPLRRARGAATLLADDVAAFFRSLRQDG